MKTTLRITCFAGALFAVSSVALAQQATPDPDLAKFRDAYTSGDGLAYVVMRDDKGERVYRYGDASRLTAKKDQRGFMLFTCAAPHVFLAQKPEDKTALQKAEVVKSGQWLLIGSARHGSCREFGGIRHTPSHSLRSVS